MLKTAFKNYMFRLLVFSIIMTSLTFGMQWLFPDYASPALPYIVLFFFLLMTFTHYLILRGIYKDNRKFVSNYVLATTIKFLSYLIFVLIYLIVNQEDRLLFAGSFIVIYFLYAIFEIVAIKREKA